MIKEKISNHLRNAGADHILNTVRKLEGQDVGMDNLHLTPNQALTAGVERYHLPAQLVRKLATPAVEATVILKRSPYPLDPQQSQRLGSEAANPLDTGAAQPSERPKIVITEESLRDH